MKYTLLPFRFERFKIGEYLLTNEVGEYLFLNEELFRRFVDGKLTKDDDVLYDLASKHFAALDNVDGAVFLLATKLRTKKSILQDFTSLHMVVPTLCCNSSCIYCQVARKSIDDHSAEMSVSTAKKIVKLIFQSPSPCIKIEFQGGEPLTDFKMVQRIIEDAEWENLFHKKQLEFVVCTNLSLMDEKKARYLKRHRCRISTSLDGPKDLHDKNRPMQIYGSSHAILEEKIQMVRAVWKCDDCVSALMTASKHSLGRFREIVDEYLRLGFNNIFFRALNPFGFAKQYKELVAYPIEDFIESYKDGLNYILDLNKQGIFFVENFAALLLKRILTPFATGFVDLQSPAGVGIAGAVYDYDGSVYVSDEARMMARFHNFFFRLGNANVDNYQTLFNGQKLHEILNSACTECLPVCSECVFQPYCGADPVRNLAEQGDMVGFRPTNDMCKKTKGILLYLFELLKKRDSEIDRIFWSWIR